MDVCLKCTGRAIIIQCRLPKFGIPFLLCEEHTSTPNILHICSESSSSDACASPSPSQLVTAGAVALLTLMATTAQRARNQGFSETAVHLWNGQPPACVGRLERASSPTPYWQTWNLDHLHRQDDRRIEVIANGLPIWGGGPASTWHHHSFASPEMANHGAKKEPEKKIIEANTAHNDDPTQLESNNPTKNQW